ncbi:hypothetical protein J5690_02490 [bacterium]|nr:hypothetical protein [bacterium]
MPEKSGLAMVVWIDEYNFYKASRHNFRVKIHNNYQDDINCDRNNLLEVDMKGKIYTISDENEKRYSIKDEDFQALMNFMHNNEYALKKIAKNEVGYGIIGYHMIKGGKVATEEKKAKLKEMTDYLSFDTETYEEYVKNHEDLLWW